MSPAAVTPSIVSELRVTKGGRGKSDTVTYRVIKANNTTNPQLGTEMDQAELDKFHAKFPAVRSNIVMA